jgi:hypothetical protein
VILFGPEDEEHRALQDELVAVRGVREPREQTLDGEASE